MKNNIFQNAYFGKAYKTRDGRKAVYLGDNTCWIEGRKIEIGYSRNGLFVDFQEHGIDIVSEWKEEINDEELDKLAEESVPSRFEYTKYTEIESFKTGFRKALEKLKKLTL